MNELRQRRTLQEPHFETVNEAWKARWGDHLARSTMLAVVAHAALFAFSPGWDRIDSSLDPDLELLDTGTEWIALDAAPVSGGGGGIVPASLALLEEPDSLPTGVDDGISLGGSGLTVVAFSGGLRERLRGRGGPVPTIVEPDPPSALPSPDDDPTDTGDEEDGEIRVNTEDPSIAAAMADPAERLETSTLDLSRLAGITPELFLPGTSAWLMIRNPAEVEDFMRQIAYRYRDDTEARGQVNVAVWVDEHGSVEWSEVTRASGRQDLDEIVLTLFNEVASFAPARNEGVRVSLSVIFSVAFPW